MSFKRLGALALLVSRNLFYLLSAFLLLC